MFIFVSIINVMERKEFFLKKLVLKTMNQRLQEYRMTVTRQNDCRNTGWGEKLQTWHLEEEARFHLYSSVRKLERNSPKKTSIYATLTIKKSK